MASQEFVLIPKEIYTSERPATEQILMNSGIKEKAKQMSLLQRNPTNALIKDIDSDIPPAENGNQITTVEENVTSEEPDTNQLIESILSELTSFTKSQLNKAKSILKRISENESVTISPRGIIILNGESTNVYASAFLHDLQQPRKKVQNPIYRNILLELHLPSQLVTNKRLLEMVERPVPENQTLSDESTDGFQTPKQERKRWDTFDR